VIKLQSKSKVKTEFDLMKAIWSQARLRPNFGLSL